MSFLKISFFLFMLVGLIVYYIFPKKLQWFWLLVLSFIYYFSFSVKCSLALVYITTIIYFAGRVIESLECRRKKEIKPEGPKLTKEEKKLIKEKYTRKKKGVVALACVFAFGLLAVIKYSDFGITNFNRIFGTDFISPKFILPIGLSFFTFQGVSYVIDVYQGKCSAEHNFFKMLLFVSFFPQIMQGPIGRYNHFVEGGLFSQHKWDLRRAQFGAQRIAWGLFKKLVMADRAGVVVSTVTANVANYSGFTNIFTLLMYSIQLYMDFSGGIDIVIGAAQMFGVTMDENFRQPYFSKSIGEFWRRWHISLGAWMKDYIFYPFSLTKAMNNLGKWGRKHFGKHFGTVLPICLANLLIFFIVGVWHGAEWRYIAYGVYNGVIIAVSAALKPYFKKALELCHINSNGKFWAGFSMLRTFILVNIGWIFDICAGGMGDCVLFFKGLFRGYSISQLTSLNLTSLGLAMYDYAILFFGCLIVLYVSIRKELGVSIRESISAKPLVIRWAVYYVVFAIILVLGYIGNCCGFMYAMF
ncbi:MBOAT family O-acyltransferase [Lachnospira multipara]|uniref:MBOAT family O-acyltransferase n=1 Tax=Lachnospira multipara TaxID=28051 RepID=UPI0004E242CE|nr:MBOAT family O-acyltransferase [Lachnospira multipara]